MAAGCRWWRIRKPAPATDLPRALRSPSTRSSLVKRRRRFDITRSSLTFAFSEEGARSLTVNASIINRTTPPWMTYQRFNDTNDLQAWLSYSNSPLLEKLSVYVVDENPPLETADEKEEEELDPSRISPY